MGRRELEVCVIGAGMSGLLMGIRLKQAGVERFRIHEKASSLGGTWRENTYPGLTCDVPSFFYSYSFEPNLDWSRRFSPGPEILAYFQGVAEKYGLLPHIRFDSKITDARWERGRWSIATGHGERTAADVLITATGALHQWRHPDIDGLEKFEGAMFHSAAWDQDVPLEGKRIGVVGNGSSGVQMMAPLSEVASHLTLFQRTAQWIAPVGNHVYTEAEKRRVHRFPFLARLTRFYYQQMFEAFSAAVVVPGRRRRAIARSCRQHLASVKDPELRRKLTPDYEPMCKRLILSRDFYPTLMKEHVEVVTEGIDHVEARGVVTKDGRLHELDVLVLATGFDTHAWGVENVEGESGRSLKEAWAEGTRAYRSVAVPGFPNFFMLIGPNSPIGNISLIDVAEVQAAYILRCLRLLRTGRVEALAPKPEATRAFHARLLEAMKDTVWVTGCSSWYLDADGVPNTWPWTARRFHREMRRPKLADFELRPPAGADGEGTRASPWPAGSRAA
jgi:cation diffusion facilitator CzcD-associated flavoprotein CzcO